jgi:hypothetical protein
MKNLISKILKKISFSVLEGNAHSTPRIQSYIVLLPILIMSFTFLGFEMYTFFHLMALGKDYFISSEIIVVYGMLLSHQLALVFSRKKNQSIKEIKGEDKKEGEEIIN